MSANDEVDSDAGVAAPGGQLDPPESPWRTLGARELYRNQWLRLTEYAVRRPDGANGIYGVVDPGDNATILALDDEENLYLVGEFRYTIQRYNWKLPSGRVDEGEEPLDAARRELREEAGIMADSWQSLGRYYLSDGVSSQACLLYLARKLHFGAAEPEGTESFTLRKLPLVEALAASLSNELDDAPTVLGVWRAWFLLHGS
jgi:8-oxo-dGTP pyrophosphatase MutT (NUDIX family)